MLALLHPEKDPPRANPPAQLAALALQKPDITAVGVGAHCSSALLMRRRSSRDGSLRSRSAGLVITKSHGMLPLFERDELAAFVSALPFSYRFALIGGGFFACNPVQLEIQLQCVAHDLGATAFAPFGRSIDLRSNFRGQRDG
jgi:hypothetical protein